jgi:hypothetical protein
MKTRVLWLALALGCGLGGACGSDAAPAMTPTLPSGGTTGSVVSGSGATSSGSSGQSAAVGGASGAGAASVVCGTQTCTAPAAIASFPVKPQACCSDATTSACGFVVNGACTPQQPLAPMCGANSGFGQQRSCCIVATNTCGADATAYGMGCLDFSAAMAGKKTLCDGTVVGPGGAAGTSAASGAGGATGGASGATGHAGAGGTSAAAGGGATAGAGGHAAAGAAATAGAGGH